MFLRRDRYATRQGDRLAEEAVERMTLNPPFSPAFPPLGCIAGPMSDKLRPTGDRQKHPITKFGEGEFLAGNSLLRHPVADSHVRGYVS